MSEFNADAVAMQLLDAARKGSGELYRLRRGLTKEQAKAVSERLSPLDRAAIRLAMKFGDDGRVKDRWKPMESGESIVLWPEDIPLDEIEDAHDRRDRRH